MKKTLQERIKIAFRYQDGVLFWVDPPPGKRRTWLIGRIAGCKSKDRWTVRFEGRLWPRHHLVWIYFKGGKIPRGDLDHRDRNAANDRIENIRPASHQNNLVNCKLYRNNTTGFRGIYFSKRRQKWVAESSSCGYVGQFDTATVAAKAIDLVGRKRYGEFWSGIQP